MLNPFRRLLKAGQPEHSRPRTFDEWLLATRAAMRWRSGRLGCRYPLVAAERMASAGYLAASDRGFDAGMAALGAVADEIESLTQGA